MFTIAAILAIPLIVWGCQRLERGERDIKPPSIDDDFAKRRVIYIREELRFIAYLLAAILVMLGIIADRLR